MAVSDRIVVMKDAEIAQMGAPAELYSHPRTVFVASFMGEANTVKARVDTVADGRAAISLGGHRLMLPANGLDPGERDLVIRPRRSPSARPGRGSPERC